MPQQAQPASLMYIRDDFHAEAPQFRSPRSIESTRLLARSPIPIAADLLFVGSRSEHLQVGLVRALNLLRS